MASEKEETSRLEEARRYWDAAAEQFDEAPDHGLKDPAVYQAWSELLRDALPDPHGAALDVGCGTGTLCLLLANLGYAVTGADLSPAMVERARAKAAAAQRKAKARPKPNYLVMDAARPAFVEGQFSALVCRHLLWALPDWPAVLRRWAALLKPGGWLLLIEGFWHTGSGLRSRAVLEALPPEFAQVSMQPLSDQPTLWGAKVSDERYWFRAQRSVGNGDPFGSI